jgi:rubrerythrin
MTSRREFLRLTGLTGVGASALLAACGGDEEVELGAPRVSPVERDVRILNSALDLEYTAIAAYEGGVGLLRGEARELGGRFLGHEREHAERLGQAIRDLGGTPNRPRRNEEYLRQFPNLRTQRDVLRFAVDLENAVVEAYVDAIPRISSPELRQTSAAIVSNEAEHISVLLGVLNPGDPLAQVPQAFVTGVAATS